MLVFTDEVSECQSEASQTGDSSGLSNQCDVFSTQVWIQLLNFSVPFKSWFKYINIAGRNNYSIDERYMAHLKQS